MHYYLIFALQIFCLYHVFKNHKPFYWYFVIFFVPILGAILYLITQVFTNQDVNTIQKEITSIVNPTKRIKDLERKIEFTDTYTNRIDLADAYFEIGAHQNAISHYETTLKDEVQNPLYAHQQLIKCYAQLKSFESVIHHVEKIKAKPEFKGSKQQFLYGLALNEMGKIEAAERQLKAIDRPYSNYNERLELAKFYIENNRDSEGKSILQDISDESQHMTKPHRKLFSKTISEVEQILKTM